LEKRMIWGIGVKTGVTLKNLLSVPLTYCILIIGITYINVKTVFLLRDEREFNIPES